LARNQRRQAYRRQLVAAISELFPPQMFAKCSGHGNAEWSAQKVVWVSVVMNWMPGTTLSERFRAARKLVRFVQPRWALPTTFPAFVAAQRRWWPTLWPLICRRLRAEESFGDAWRVLGWLVLAVDGSRFECPRTTDNEKGLQCAGREKTSPQIFQTTLQHVGTGLLWDVRLGPGTDSERRHLDGMLPDLPSQALLTADAGFISYELCDWLCRNNCTFVLRVGGNITLLEDLGWKHEQRGETVYLWPQDCRNRPPIVLRQVRFLSTGGLPVVLLTNEFNHERLSDEAIRTIYSARWGIEIYYRTFKQTWGFQRLLSRTPETALNEQRWRIVSLWSLQWMVAKQLHAAGQDPRRFSGAQARRLIREFLQDLQQGDAGVSLAKRLQGAQTDDYTRSGPKQTRKWPRKKNDSPPQPPKIRPATPKEIQKAKELDFLIRLIC
jgi:Transposase DDE domain